MEARRKICLRYIIQGWGRCKSDRAVTSFARRVLTHVRARVWIREAQIVTSARRPSNRGSRMCVCVCVGLHGKYINEFTMRADP